MNDQAQQPVSNATRPIAGVKPKVWLLVRYLWTTLVIVGAAYYIVNHAQEFIGLLNNLSLEVILLATAFLLIGKFFVSESARLSLHGIGIPISCREMYVIYIKSDAAKYLPGGVWGFVGRVSAYSYRKIPAASSAKALVLENIWLIASSMFAGLLFSLQYVASWIVSHTSYSLDLSVYIVGGVLALLGWGACMYFSICLISTAPDRVKLTLKILGIHTCIAVLLGLHFWVFLWDYELLFLAVGVFAIARLAGYVAFFAPAGIGVREAVIVAMLSGIVDAPYALFLAATSRGVTVVAEFLTLLVVVVFFRRRQASREANAI